MEQFTIEWFDRQTERAYAAMRAQFEAERQAELAWQEAEKQRFDTAEAEFQRLRFARNAKTGEPT